ncbi:uncharacterized protein LOC111402853 [Olea europaea var. sylvestris]|uniref:uncharacterized protein LOC111402853 n=1 Tax=Olea europaea var. sylvestris TaxID=158386 RepID=UPI000C1D6027|nr:uncharacterized protein LOC111402853 [Olea europaea var. sylvestris]
MNNMQDFEFLFSLHFMFENRTITDDLLQALQKKDKDIQNAMRHILVPNMEDIVVVKGRPRCVAQQVTYFHRFYVDLYCHAIDSILQELNDRFPETTTKLFTCISCLSQRDSFAAFDNDKLLRLTQFYPLDFNSEELFSLISFFCLLLTLALILLVATASGESVFSAMNLIKSDLRNKMGDDCLNINLVV